jgi:anti-sigma B factor antagonist
MRDHEVFMGVRQAGPRVSVIDVRGDLTAAAVDALDGAYAAAGAAGSIVLNFGGLSELNSGGIDLLVTLLIRARRQGCRLLACGLSEHCQRIFTLTRLNEAIRVCTDEADALRAVGAA